MMPQITGVAILLKNSSRRRIRNWLISVSLIVLGLGSVDAYSQNNESENDEVRRTAVDQIISALETHAVNWGSYRIWDHGSAGGGQGWFHRSGGSYGPSLYSRLERYLNGAVPADPQHLDITKPSSNDFLLFRCKKRIAVFSIADTLLPSTQDHLWWLENDCPLSPIENFNHQYFRISRSLDEFDTPFDSRRKAAVNDIVDALQKYASIYGTYKIDGVGSRGTGQGWFHHTSATYPASVYSALAEFLTYVPSDPLHFDVSRFQPEDFMVYRCKNRIAVFAKTDKLQPTSSDINWWQKNGCTNSPMLNYDHKYYQVSEPVNTSNQQLQASVNAIITAFEAYHDDNGTHKLQGYGYRGNGQGWYYQRNTGSYSSSIHDGLNAYLENPLENSSQFLVYLCKGRVGVFAQSSTLTPTAADQNWWTTNNCASYPISKYNYQYFQISADSNNQ